MSFALSDGFAPVAFVIQGVRMEKRTLSLYIDESGVLDKENPTSRFYLISFVAHNEDDDVAGKVEDFKRGLDSIGIANACFHAGPIIYGNDQFRVLNWDLRRRIFSRMMGLVRRVPFVCTCLEVDKHFCDTTEKVNAKIEGQLASLIDGHRLDLGGFECVLIYYDCGQKQLTKFLLSFFEKRTHIPVEYAQGATPWKHIFLQVADLVATLRFIELKMQAGLPMTKSEYRFFGGPRRFKHDVLRAIKDHWLN